MIITVRTSITVFTNLWQLQSSLKLQRILSIPLLNKICTAPLRIIKKMHHTCIIWMQNNADMKEDLILTTNWTTWALENNPENIKREKERQPDRELHVLVSQLNYSLVRLTSSMAGHYVQSFQRSGFGSQSSLTFFRFFFHWLGCSVNHIFVYIALNCMQSLVVCGP